ncbi:hypothetical protein G3T36_03855 [Diaminobutyricibacter tongyongensis]|uniref:DoxX family protein n=1 Tax=Leifsonia tongyongensis TaxID=1268043 RepID=A0A6L9XVG7_9MICO|nr:DoxX family protein [Diaminobutyricibacter tongyongensis]NEN04998.1 hypothetical protein [Diaminobutyricibacter tongyongensis]
MIWLYWIAVVPQVLIYTAVGMLKIVRSKPRLVADNGFDWADSVPAVVVKGIGGLELAAVAALVVPMLLGWGPILPVAASIGLVALQLGAAVTNVRFADKKKLPLDALLILLALVAGAAALAIGWR